MKKLPLRDPGAALQRRAIAERRVGVGAKCGCGETRPLALIPKSKPKSCAKCQREKKGITIMDKHHVFAKANDSKTVIPIPVNDHRAELNEAQNDWPKRTRENVDGSPFLAAAGCIRGFIDTVVYLIEQGLLWIAGLLEMADKWATDRFGPRYWIGTPLESLGPQH